MLEPSQFVMDEIEAFPQDVQIIPKISVIGFPATGKSELCQKISSVTGAVHLQLEDIIEDQVERDSSFSKKLRERIKVQGKEVDDLYMIQVIQKRVEYADCQRNGWVLEGFPQTRGQAMLMAKKGLLPSNLFLLRAPIETVYTRTAPHCDTDFGCNRIVLKKRLQYFMQNQHQAAFFYQKFYNNVSAIDATRSKWYVWDTALQTIKGNMQARMNFARDFTCRDSDVERPCVMQNLNIDRFYFKQSISQYGHFCPVSWKLEKKFMNCTHIPEFSVLYKNLFYFFANTEARDIFVANPKRFTENILFSQERNIPVRLAQHKAAEIAESEKNLLGYCAVSLMD